MILQRLQELYHEITAGRFDSTQAASHLTSKLEFLHQRLEDGMLKTTNTRESPRKPVSNNTSYTTYYNVHGEGRNEEDWERRKSSSTPNLTARFGSRSDTFSPRQPHEREGSPAMVKALRSELEEMRRWNEALQARLDEMQRARHVGVGMEKEEQGQKDLASCVAIPLMMRDRKYAELTQEVDHLLKQLEAEKEKSRKERRQQQAEVAEVQATLRQAEKKVLGLEEQMQAAMLLRDSSTSTSDLSEEMARLEREVKEAHSTTARVTGHCEGMQKNLAELQRQLDGSHETIVELRAQLEFERRENRRLKGELVNLSSILSTDDSLAASSSLPNLSMEGLNVRIKSDSHRQKSDSWTTPPPGRGTKGNNTKADVSALKAKNEDMTRLNDELQRKCQDQLLKTPPHSTSSNGGHLVGSSVQFQSSLQEQREELPKEEQQQVMMDKERELLAQVREAEQLLLEKEEVWLSTEESLRQEGEELKKHLTNVRKDEEIRIKVMLEVQESVKSKDERIIK